MAAVNKIDSNVTGLRFAIENADGTLPANPTWYPLEPNSYDDFGAELKTVARNPINDSRQRKKGVVVDLDAKAGFEMDVTSDNTERLMQSFMFAQARTKNRLSVASVGASGDDYKPVSGGAAYFANNLLFAKGFSTSANNGLKKVTGTPGASSVGVTTALEDEGGAEGTISLVGHEFGSGVATIDVSGSLPKLVASGIVAASQVLTFTDQPADTETVTIGSTVYTFQDTLTNVAGNVKIGATLAASITNLKNAINRNNLGTPGTDFAALTEAHPSVTATGDATTLTVTAIVAGTPGNSIATTDTVADASWGAATLAGGTGRSLKDFGLIPGEYVCLGDDGAGMFFANTENNGLKRVREVTNTEIIFDKSTVAMVTDAGTGKTIRIFFCPAIIKNEAAELVVRQTVQFERTLGAPDTSSTDKQAEYLLQSVADQLDLEVKTADKVTMKLGFMSTDQETRTAGEGLKDGTRPVIQESDAFNSSSHVARLSLARVTDGDEAPSDLFAFLLDLTLSINNNVKANKAIKYLGSFDHSAGTFAVDAKMTAYFSTVEAIRAVRDNASVTLDITFAQANRGITLDLPLVTLATEGADVKQDEAIQLPISSTAATGASIDTNLNHTLLVGYWDYIPDLAA